MPKFRVYWFVSDSVDGRKQGHEDLEAEDEFEAEAIAEDLMSKAADPTEDMRDDSAKFAKFGDVVNCGTCPTNWGILRIKELKK